jgi:mannobiose 2-epimerase
MMMNDLRQRIEHELRGNLLPFWIEHTRDEEHGGFYGGLTNDLIVDNDQPRSAVLCARILWTYSSAYRTYGEPWHLDMARRAYDYLTQKFWDQQYGGVYWTLDRGGCPTNDRKHIYAQAFAIYGLAEFYRATGEPQSLRLAQDLFDLIERYSFDPVYGGNLECCSRAWGPLADMRLSDKEPNTRKSMNTLLHLMEAYTNLLRVWPDVELHAKQRGLIEMFLQRIIDPQTYHFRLFFDDAWTALTEQMSFGHDMEGSWLIVEAAEVSCDAALLAQAQAVAVKMAAAVYRDGLDSDGAVLNEATPRGIESTDRHWWVQAEGLVGFFNAYQLSQRAEFAQEADRLWQICETQFVDRQYGEWFKIVRCDGTPDLNQLKVGPWECPYHHSRACFEMLHRLT